MGEGRREANLLWTALLPRILVQGLEIESGSIGKPLILPLAALVWREQGDSREGRGLSAWAGGREELDGESRSAAGRPAHVPRCEQCPCTVPRPPVCGSLIQPCSPLAACLMLPGGGEAV